MNNKEVRPYGPFQIWVLNNFPFTIDDWDSITQYQMLCKCLGALKEQLDVNSDLYKKITDLENYVANYFENLDVQEEINNKLDEMAESGQLEEIIAEYLDTQALITFNSVSEMKSATNLRSGSKCRTLGYYNVNDGGGATYYVREVTNQDTENDIDIIALSDESLVAELIITPFINVLSAGCKGDNEFDNADILEQLLDIAHDKESSLFFPHGSYRISRTLQFKVSLYGVGCNYSFIKATTDFTGDFMLDFYHTGVHNNNKEIVNLRFDGQGVTGLLGSSADGAGSFFTKFDKVNFRNSLKTTPAISFSTTGGSAVSGALTGSLFNQCTWTNNGRNLVIGQNMDDVLLVGCRFGNIIDSTSSSADIAVTGNAKFENCYFALPTTTTATSGVKRFFQIGTQSVVFDKCFFEQVESCDLDYLFMIPSGHGNLTITNCNFNITSAITNLDALIRTNLTIENLDFNIKVDNIKFTNYNDSDYSSTPIVEYYCGLSSYTLGKNNLYVDRLNTFALPTFTGTAATTELGHLYGNWNNNQYNERMFYSYNKFNNKITILEQQNDAEHMSDNFVFTLPEYNTKWKLELVILADNSVNYCYTNTYTINSVSGQTNNKATVSDRNVAFTNDSSTHRITNVSVTISGRTVTVSCSISGTAVRVRYLAQLTQLYARYNRL